MLYKNSILIYIQGMKKLQILLLLAALTAAMMSSATAKEIKIAKADLNHFIGIYSESAGTFVDFKTGAWSDDDPMSYFNVVNALPADTDTYFALAPWYTNLVNAVLEVPEIGLAYVSFVDLKQSQKARARIAEWRMDGDSLTLVCVADNFPGLNGAPNLDGCFRFPDLSRFLVVRSAGGDMERVWVTYTIVVDDSDCSWRLLYTFTSERLMSQPEFTEGYCRLVEDFNMQVITKTYKAQGKANSDGTYNHEVAEEDTLVVNLWDLAQKGK